MGTVVAKLDGVSVANGQVIDLLTLALGERTFTVDATDKAGNASTSSVKFTVADTTPPVITINSPTAMTYSHTEEVTVDFSVTDVGSGVGTVVAKLDGVSVANGHVIDLLTLALGERTFTVDAADKAGNTSTKTVVFSVAASIDSLQAAVENLFGDGEIKNAGLTNSLLSKLDAAEKSIAAGRDRQAMNQLEAFINEVKAQTGKGITEAAAALLIADAQWIIDDLE